MKKATWTGSISFGLANIPVKLYTSTEETGPKLSQVTKAGQKVNMVRLAGGRSVKWDDTYRGVEVTKGEYVVLDPAALTALRPERSKTIQIDRFVSAKEIDPWIIKDKHILGPDKGGARWYGLFRAVLRSSDRVGLGRVVLGSRERVVAVGLRGEAIVMATLAYCDELTVPDELLSLDGDIPEPDPKTLSAAIKLVKSMGGKFDHSALEDTYCRDLVALVERTAASRATPGGPKSSTPADDLMAALEGSIKKQAKPRRSRKAVAK